MIYEAVEITRAFGNATQITFEERYSGPLEFVARPDGGAWLMKPVSELVRTNEKDRKAGIMEISALDRFDQRLRVVLSLGKPDTARVLAMRDGEELTLIRKGWGRTWRQRILCRGRAL